MERTVTKKKDPRDLWDQPRLRWRCFWSESGQLAFCSPCKFLLGSVACWGVLSIMTPPRLGSHTLPVFLPFYFPSLWGIRGLNSSQPTGDRGPRMGYTDKNKNDSQDQLALAVTSGSLSPAQNRKHPLCFYLFASEKIIVSSLKTAPLSLSMYLRLSRVCFDL